MDFRFAVLCDLHLPYIEETAQYAAFEWALKKINEEKPDFCIVAGDITACGELSSIQYFYHRISKLNMPVETVLGNSDYRDAENINKINAYVSKKNFCFRGRRVLSLNTPSGKIEEHEKGELLNCGDGSIVILHHSIEGLEKDSREVLTQWAGNNTGLIIHAHSHKNRDYFIGKTRVIGIRPIDPDKSIGKRPCVTLFEIAGDYVNIKEAVFEYPTENILDFKENIGIACFDVRNSIEFATTHNIKNIELKEIKPGDKWLRDTVNQVEKFRESGGKLVSVHMPNVVFDGQKLIFDEKCEAAINLVSKVKPQKVTMHPPRKVMAAAMEEDEAIRSVVTGQYCRFLGRIPQETQIGIENLHMKETENKQNRCFGYIPREIKFLVNEAGKYLGRDNIGIVLDTGHARNNGYLSSKYTLGAWYKEVGESVSAYHLHQIGRSDDGKMKNHTAIHNWAGGPAICYESFFWAWQTGQLNHAPVFLEMRSLQDYEISLSALEEYLLSRL